MPELLTKNNIDEFLSKLENFNENSQEDEIEQLSSLASFIMNLGAGVSPSIKKLLGKNQQVNYELLDYLIKTVNAEKMKIIYSSGILRYTSYYMDKFPSYNILLTNVEKQCIKQNKNAEEILAGLKD